ncbi:MAG: LptF/LptG family permease, partial [Mucinivorans sp.]
KMAYDTEIIAILSSGVSFRRLLWPYFVAALAITSLSLTLNLYLIPKANQGRIAFEEQYMRKKGAYNSDSYEPYIYRQVGPNTIVFLRYFNRESMTANYFVLESYDGGKIVSSLEAQDAKFSPETGRWTAPKYLHRYFEGENERFIKSEIPMDTIINLTAQELSREDELIQTMNSFELSRFIDQQRAKGSDMVALFEVENYGRYAYPISTFILTLIGVSLSSRKVRGGTGLHIGVGIALCFSYIVLMRFAGEFAKSGMLPAWLAIWSPNILYTCIGIYLYIKAPK